MNCITFRSITTGQRAQILLKRQGILSYLQRTPRSMEQQGCGYCLRLRREDVLPAAEILRRGNIGFRQIYQE